MHAIRQIFVPAPRHLLSTRRCIDFGATQALKSPPKSKLVDLRHFPIWTDTPASGPINPSTPFNPFLLPSPGFFRASVGYLAPTSLSCKPLRRFISAALAAAHPDCDTPRREKQRS